MKKILLSLFVVAVMGFTAKVQAQCTVSNLSIEVISFNTSTCQVNFNISFEQEVNSGNKFAYIHLWTSAAYHTPAAAWPSSGGGVVYNNPSNAPESAQLINTLKTIAIEFNGTATPVLGNTYYPDPTVVLSTAGMSITKTILPGGVTERETISGLSLTLPSCSGVVTFKGDIWASQANNGSNVHCVVQGLTFDINNPQITSAFKVCAPRSISFAIKNNGSSNLTEHFVLYKDDGDGIFEPFTGQDGPSIYTSTDTVLSPGGIQSRVQFPYPGSTTPGESASIWLEVVVPATGFTTVAFISNSAVGCLALPVQIISFSAIRNRSSVSLKWTTMTEQDNSGFAIERNLSGNWEQVGFVASQAPGGNSADLLNYNYSDINTNRGITQYRIRQTDINGRSRYSEIRTVRGESQSGGVIVYPNPSIDGKVNLSFEDASASRDITVSDMNGRMVKQLKGITASSVTIESLLPGIYSVRVFVPSTGEQFVQKIVVNRR